jgi:predicted Fe-Mo cluster-binding NifX family protein
MKIAVITDDGKTISQHFGMAPLYVVLTIEDGKITNRETRSKMGHQHFAPGENHEHGPAHGFDADSQDKHATMALPISDCKVLIAGGMGMGAFQSLKSYNIEAVITDAKNIDEAVKLYAEGKLPNLTGRLH